MNQRVQKINAEIERTKARITELQALLPELEHKKTDLENTEILRLVRSANIAPGEIAAFIASIKTNNRQDSRTNSGSVPRPASSGVDSSPNNKQEDSDHEEQ